MFELGRCEEWGKKVVNVQYWYYKTVSELRSLAAKKLLKFDLPS